MRAANEPVIVRADTIPLSVPEDRAVVQSRRCAAAAAIAPRRPFRRRAASQAPRRLRGGTSGYGGPSISLSKS